MKIRLYSQYNHFPHLIPENGEKAVEMYNDGKIWEAFQNKPHGECALLIEPRPLQPETYWMLETKYNRFKWIFTHDTQLLRIAPNAKPIYYWNQYQVNDEEKTKDISMICGAKQMCSLHAERMKIAEALKGKVDILGDIWGQERVTIHDAYAPYKFAVVIENHIDDRWFTEKVLNCFANKTVPIYFGARDIKKQFYEKGIICVDRLWDIPNVVDNILRNGADMEYNVRKEAIWLNSECVYAYSDFEDYMIKEYGSLLEEMMEDAECLKA